MIFFSIKNDSRPRSISLRGLAVFQVWAMGGGSFFVRLLALHDALAGQQLDGFPDGAAFIAIFKNSAYQNSIFAICSLRMLLVH